MQSRASWSRRTTPASTPRVTPLSTPIPTPRHSPPKDTGSHFPAEFVKRNEVGPPPGFGARQPSARPAGPPPGFDGMPDQGAHFNAGASGFPHGFNAGNLLILQN